MPTRWPATMYVLERCQWAPSCLPSPCGDLIPGCMPWRRRGPQAHHPLPEALPARLALAGPGRPRVAAALGEAAVTAARLCLPVSPHASVPAPCDGVGWSYSLGSEFDKESRGGQAGRQAILREEAWQSKAGTQGQSTLIREH